MLHPYSNKKSIVDSNSIHGMDFVNSTNSSTISGLRKSTPVQNLQDEILETFASDLQREMETATVLLEQDEIDSFGSSSTTSRLRGTSASLRGCINSTISSNEKISSDVYDCDSKIKNNETKKNVNKSAWEKVDSHPLMSYYRAVIKRSGIHNLVHATVPQSLRASFHAKLESTVSRLGEFLGATREQMLLTWLYATYIAAMGGPSLFLTMVLRRLIFSSTRCYATKAALILPSIWFCNPIFIIFLALALSKPLLANLSCAPMLLIVLFCLSTRRLFDCTRRHRLTRQSEMTTCALSRLLFVAIPVMLLNFQICLYIAATDIKPIDVNSNINDDSDNTPEIDAAGPSLGLSALMLSKFVLMIVILGNLETHNLFLFFFHKFMFDCSKFHKILLLGILGRSVSDPCAFERLAKLGCSFFLNYQHNQNYNQFVIYYIQYSISKYNSNIFKLISHKNDNLREKSISYCY